MDGTIEPLFVNPPRLTLSRAMLIFMGCTSVPPIVGISPCLEISQYCETRIDKAEWSAVWTFRNQKMMITSAGRLRQLNLPYAP